MAIKKVFKNASIGKPGAYSHFDVNKAGGSPLTANNTLFIIGESSQGDEGANTGIKSYSASQVSSLIDYYGKGPIVDAAIAGIRPSSSSLIGGFGEIQVWKTNGSTQASLTCNNGSAEALLILKDKKYGVDGNNIYVTIENGVTDAVNGKIITIKNLGETTEVMDENPVEAQLTVYYETACTTCTLSIAGASKAAKTLTTSVDGGGGLSIPLQTYTIKQLVDKINSTTGYIAVLSNTARGTITSATDLDLVTAINIKAIGMTKTLYRLQEELVELINENSDYVEASLHATPRTGLPANIADSFLTGGVQGSSSNSDFSAGLAKSMAQDYAVVVPLISQDATDDIALGSIYDGGFVTDAASDYTISSVHAAVKSHLILRSAIKNKKEALGIVGIRESTIADAYTASETLASELVQCCVQDVKILDAEGSARWKQPHILAVLAAGIRCGTDIGEPLTYKYINALDVKHYVDMADDESEDGDFNPDVDYDDAINSGVLFVEKVSGAYRFVVDNTTYGLDGSFVFNRGSVMEAAHYIAKTLRATCDSAFVGKKVSNGAASSVKSVLRAKLEELNRENITVASIGAPKGYVEDTFIVNQIGNATYVQVQVYPVQGMDFFFISFSLEDLQQSA